MKVSTILDHIDSGHMALPEFQRGYVWNRNQVRGLMDSLYRRHPVGSLLVWATESKDADHRGGVELAPGVVKLLLDGQQRITTLYGLIRGTPPRFFEGNEQAFTGLHFHLEEEKFAFYSPNKMKGDPLWVDVSDLFEGGNDRLGTHVSALSQNERFSSRVSDYVGRLSGLLGIRDIDFHIDEVTGGDKTIDVVVDIFNRVNSGGTKLSKGDLALAKICAQWPEGRERMRSLLDGWREAEYHFDLDWLLRNVNTVTTGEAKFEHLHEIEAAEVEAGLVRAEKAISQILDLIGGRLGLDHDRVLFGRYAIPVMSHYLDRRGGHFADAREQDRLLFWYVQSAMWGRFSGSTESVIDKDLKVLEDLDGGLDRLIEQLQLWHGSLQVQPGHYGGWSLGARFYPMLYLLTRVGSASDWGTGLPLKKGMLGKMSALEVHHIFPKAQLYKRSYERRDVNAVANFCFLTKDTNLAISDRLPEEYLPEVEAKHPGALASQWVPMDPALWKMEAYPDFLEARRVLLAEATNRFLGELFHGSVPHALEEPALLATAEVAAQVVPGGIESEDEERLLEQLNQWVVANGLPEGDVLHEIVRPESGEQLATLDLAWPRGLQEGLTEPVAVLIDEGPDTFAAANLSGFRCFGSLPAFKAYVTEEVLPGAEA